MEKDVSVRQMAVDLLYAMCDRSNAEEIVQEMLNYLETADYSIREEMVLKVAILAEKYATDFTWLVNVNCKKKIKKKIFNSKSNFAKIFDKNINFGKLLFFFSSPKVR